ncbi:Astacin-like metalloendopeptidase [Strongyloides ratti]|uniref:Zinc metalloproteinase n=1 Tax=Strongyloides ratti TaxID=34506 RepID=A0A090MJV7_STRRB|nr:Astacin-like metalloendopeptidase [Strongyloides ratti]CEG06160.1 Astacin-like metalloendopeptidase [Strongyloides ratti]
MYFFKEFLLIIILSLLIKARRLFDIRNDTRKNLSSYSKKNFDSTIVGLKRLNRLQRRLMGLKNNKKNIDENSEILIEDPMTNPNLFQGDIILTENQVDEIALDIVKQAEEKKIDINDIENKTDILNRKKRSIAINSKYNWIFPIPYYVDTGVNATVVDLALAEMVAETCVRFSKSLSPITGKAGLRYFLGSGCWSYIGKIFDVYSQDISIGNGCGYNGIIQHETSHALGLHHEQTRPNRDAYVSINTENIISGMESNFFKSASDSVNSFGVPYDYGSVMHYGRFDFSKNGNETIVSKVKYLDKTMGQHVHLSFNDIKLINYRYCSSICTNKISCFNGGYQNPNNCLICKCPSGFTGKSCLEMVKNIDTKCGNNLLTATSTKKTLSVTGVADCYYFINTTVNNRIKITINSATLYYLDPCIVGKGLEIKYRNDKTMAGYNFCGSITNKIVTSIGDTMLIHYAGKSFTHSFNLSYNMF